MSKEGSGTGVSSKKAKFIKPVLGFITLLISVWVLYKTLGNNLDGLIEVFSVSVGISSIVAILLHALSNSLLAKTWTFMVNALGSKLSTNNGLYIWTRAQLTRYVIGSAGLVSRPVMAKAFGVPIDVGTSSTLLESVWLMALLGLGLPFVSSLLDLGGGLLILAGIGSLIAVIGLTFFPKTVFIPIKKLRPTLKTEGLKGVGVKITSGYLIQLSVRVIAFLLMAYALNINSVNNILLLVGAFLSSYLVGWLFIFSPGGLGPREAVAGLILSSSLLEPSEVLALVALSRIVEVLGELLFVAYVRTEKSPSNNAGIISEIDI